MLSCQGPRRIHHSTCTQKTQVCWSSCGCNYVSYSCIHQCLQTEHTYRYSTYLKIHVKHQVSNHLNLKQQYLRSEVLTHTHPHTHTHPQTHTHARTHARTHTFFTFINAYKRQYNSQIQSELQSTASGAYHTYRTSCMGLYHTWKYGGLSHSLNYAHNTSHVTVIST